MGNRSRGLRAQELQSPENWIGHPDQGRKEGEGEGVVREEKEERRGRWSGRRRWPTEGQNRGSEVVLHIKGFIWSYGVSLEASWPG